LVYDVRNRNKLPIYSSSVKTKKHSDPVWQIMWNPDISIYFNFYSISSDGRVMNWILMKDKLEPEEVIKLKLVNKKNKQNDEETSLISLACGLCFDFNKFDPFTFIVGTEEGNIHKCSKAYSGQYQETYDGHQLAIYKIRWNPFHKRTFISASADWTVKIWDSRYKSPVMSFDLGQAMVDVMWSPFSASVFVALSLEKTYVYDLREDRHTRIAENKPVKSKCTNLAWNWQQPVILVGDSHGGVNSFKLSKH
jgi:dynein intermediate chain 1